MTFLSIILVSFVESFWRRWFGGGYNIFKNKVPSWLYSILKSRGFQTVINLLLLIFIFIFHDNWTTTPISNWLINNHINKWILATLMAIIFQIGFWQLGHGKAFDIGRAEPVDDDGRYQEYWWTIIPNKLIPQEYWYGYLYDFIWMTVRYSINLIFLIPFLWSFNILWLGLITASIYAFCWSIHERDNWLFKYIPYNLATCSTELAELMVGFSAGLFLISL